MATECELKLELPADAQVSGLGELLSLGPARTVQMRARYFDTPDFALARHDMSLRIRQEGRRRVQTLKTSERPSGATLTRREWERPARGQSPVLDADNPVRALLGKRVGDLSEQFEVAVERKMWTVETPGAVIELALDRGQAGSGTKTARFCEIELELHSGTSEALFLLGRRIARLTPARIGVLTKAERARRMVQLAGKADKARPVPLTDDMTAADAFRLIVRNCLSHYRLNEMQLIGASDAEAVHQARVALRRLRSALDAFHPVVKGRKAEQFDEELRWLAGLLGEARDLDVLIERMHDASARRRLEGARAHSYARIRDAVGSNLVRELIFDISEWVSVGAWAKRKAAGRVARKVADEAVARLHHKLLHQAETIVGASDELRHKARKTAKKLRYTLEFFARLYDAKGERKARNRYLAGLEALQEHLGALNDIAVMPETLEQVGIPHDKAFALVATAGRPDMLRLQAADALAVIRKEEAFWA